MNKNWQSLLWALAVVVSLMIAQPVAAAGAEYEATPPSAAAMGFDVLLVRPLSIVATAAGGGLFLLSLPFSALGLNTDEAAVRLVGEPATFAFLRPLGEFRTAATVDSTGY